MPDATTIITKLLHTHQDVATSMRAALAQLPTAELIFGNPTPAKEWEKLSAIDWTQDRAAFLDACTQLFAPGKIPAKVRGVWAGVPEIECNPAMTYFAGYANFRAKDDSFEWADEPIWSSAPAMMGIEPEDASAATEDLGVNLAALAEVQRLFGFKDGGSAGQHADLCYSLPIAYLAFLLADAFATIRRDVFPAKRDPIGIACTFAGGDGVVVGTLSATGWTLGV